MNSEWKTNLELLKELESLKIKYKRSVKNHIAIRKEAEKREKQSIDEINFLYKTALEWVQLDSQDNIYQFIARN